MKNQSGWIFFGGLISAAVILGYIGGWFLAQGQAGAGALIGVLLAAITLAVVGSLKAVLQVLDRYEQGLPVKALPERGLDPFGGLARRVNRLTATAQQAHGLREQWLSQTGRQAAQEERNRLARDLHDSIKQQLYSIQMSSAAAQARFDEDWPGAQSALADVQRSAHEALVEMNALLLQLSPAPLERVGLSQAIREQCEALGYRSGAQVECEIGELPGEELLPPGAQEAVFRVVQEALSNTARHARAKHVQLHLCETEDGSGVALVVRDDGQGFDAQNGARGAGLAGMRARAAGLDGRLEVESTPGLGTRVTLRIPYQAAEMRYPAKVQPVLARTVLTGLLGGALLSGVLLLPWGQINRGQLPAIVTPGEFSWLAGLVILVIPLLPAIGRLAAGWAKPGSRTAAALCGAAAGALAGLTIFGLVGASIAGSRGALPVLLHGLAPTSGGGETAALLIASFSNIFLLVHLVFWLLLAGGAGLGLLGGLSARQTGVPVNLSAELRAAAAALTGGGAVGLFITAMLMPLSESSTLDQIQLFLLPSSQVLLRGAVVVAILSPALFFFGGLALNYRLLQGEAARADGQDLARIQRAAFQQACLSAWTGTACALWGGVYLFMASKEEVPVLPINGLICLGLVLIVSALWTVRIGRLALQMRRVLIETGQLSLSDAEAAGWFVLPYFLLLSFLGIWYGPWMVGLALAALVAGGGLGLYALVTRSEKKPGARFWMKESAELAASWPAIVLGLVGPLLPALASGLAVLALPIRFLPYLDNHPDAVGLSVPRLLAEYSAYQPLSFVGLLLLVAAFIGLIALFGTLRTVLIRKSV